MADQILIVDDEPGIRHLLQQTLADERYKVQTAGTVFEAIEKLHETSFALAIVDLLLPDVDGLQLAEAIRIIDPGTPVVLISAYGTPAFEGMASHPAIRHYLHKPFSLDRLLELVRRYVPSPELNGN
ncbi:MAG: response regulator [Anaerolineae bacterium]|nr:response regulator [Anaerolineae bacterium]